ncbi:hypothetical protein A6J52_05565 [Moraxella catarrhalis]|nr:hypothetical protein A6J52_05565 [Moraxella catarrhalis]MPW88911.1 hypothetical protein [Moraxella catarrhalis]
MTNNTIIATQQTLEENRAGFRTQLGTQLRNERIGQVMRKILAYNFCFVSNKQLGNPPFQFELLISSFQLRAGCKK